MNKSLTCLILLSTYTPAVDQLPEQINITPWVTHAHVIHEKPSDLQNSPSLFASFTDFVRIFFAIITNEQVLKSVRMIDNLLQSLIRITFSIIQSNSIKYITHKDGLFHIEHIDPQIQQSLEAIITEQTNLYITRGKTRPTQAQKLQYDEDDEQTKIILGHFACIVNNFFNIVQDPENRNVVTPNLLGMFTGIMNIGAEVMKRNALTLHATSDDIALWASQCNVETKRAMLALMLQI